MSALPPKSGHKTAIRDLSNPDVRFGVENVRSSRESGHWMTVLGCPLWAKSGHQ
jgi:hypothetical protein